MNKGIVYICDPQLEAQEQLSRILKNGGYTVEVFASGAPLLKALAESHGAPPDMVLIDSSLEEDSLEMLRQVKARTKELPVMIISAYASVRSAVSFLKQGACDYLVKPIINEELLQLLGHWIDRRRLVAENRSLRAEVQRRFDPSQVVFRSEGFSKVLSLANRVAASEASVLILGESGVGKELVASTIHYSSERSDRRFLTINCAALTDTLLESQLFGHVKGAFTGATNTHRGLVEEANRGTLFLDEIGDISPTLQAKLLRLLQEKEFLPVGSTRVQHADVRFVAATNRDLEAAVASGSFREDLYYRLNVITLNVPPLRERFDDIKPLAEFFVTRYASVAGQEISTAVMDLLQAYPWPGNVRELENVMEMSCILSGGETIQPEHLAVRVKQGMTSSFTLPQTQMTLDEVERLYIEQVYQQTNYHKVNSSQILGISRKTLDRKLKQYSIHREQE
jgi:DNA-binding NtrC family response regulator